MLGFFKKLHPVRNRAQPQEGRLAGPHVLWSRFVARTARAPAAFLGAETCWENISHGMERDIMRRVEWNGMIISN